MNNTDHLNRLGLFDTGVSRDTSEPTAPVFKTYLDHMFQMAARDPDISVSLFVHIPVSERLCGFCACRTQGRPFTRVIAQQCDSDMDTGAIYSKAS